MVASATEVASWLDWAGTKLLALRLPSAAPAGYRNYWPDYATDASAAYGYTRPTLRAPAVAPEEVTMMDKILGLPGFIADANIRRIVHKRLLITPVSNRRVNSFTKIAKELHTDARLAARLYLKGLDEIARKIPTAQVVVIQAFFANVSNRS